MRRLIAILILLQLSLGLTGCSLFKRNTGGSGGGGGGDYGPNAVPPPKFPTGDSKDPLTGSRAADKSRATGLLAGRVLDGNTRPPGGTSILVIPADARDSSEGRELSVSPEGYFTIENLERGGEYKLVARGKQGDRAVAGVHYATATNVHVLIQMKEDLVSSTTPNVQGPFGSLNEGKGFEPLTPPRTETAKEGWRPGSGGVDVASNEVTLPTVDVAVRPDSFTTGSLGVIPPPLEIKPRPKSPEFAKIVPPMPPPRVPEPPPTLGSAGVPSCVLVGRQLVNFALNDINGEPWELKSRRKTKLVLLDFWGTWCAPCRQTMPALKGLQTKYRGGFEVVGIAYEQEGTPEDQAHKVNDVCQKLLINYRQLLGSGSDCVVKRQLGVRAFPTLILIDETGTILWRHEGRPTSADLEELERLIQTRSRTTAAS